MMLLISITARAPCAKVMPLLSNGKVLSSAQLQSYPSRRRRWHSSQSSASPAEVSPKERFKIRFPLAFSPSRAHKRGKNEVANAIVDGFSGRKKQATSVIAMLEKLSAAELNELICSPAPTSAVLAMSNTLRGVENAQETVGKPMMSFILKRTARAGRAVLLEYLTNERLGDLRPESKASLIEAIRLDTRSKHLKKVDVEAVANIFLRTKGSELSELKDFIGTVIFQGNTRKTKWDGVIPFHAAPYVGGDLHHLIYRDILEQETRFELLQHFAVEASAMEGYDRKPRLKIISDIDDTLYAGYPRGVLYPGVREFYRHLGPGPVPIGLDSMDSDEVVMSYESPSSSRTLSSSISSDDSSDEISLTSQDSVEERTIDSEHEGVQTLAGLTFLTARPVGWRGLIKKLTVRSLAAQGITTPTILAGSLSQSYSSKTIARTKFKHFIQFKCLYPECSFVFNGDSGQGDAALGAMMLEKYRHLVRAVFIHDVRPHSAMTGDKLRTKDDYRRLGLEFYQTYVGAAAAAYRKSLITDVGLREVMESAVEDLEKMDWSGDDNKKDQIATLLREDIDKAQGLLP